MREAEVWDQVLLGEDSRNQFKASVESPDALAAECCAFGNTDGGRLFVGVSDARRVVGIPDEDLDRLNQLVANVTTHNIRPPLFVTTALVRVEGKRVMVVDVPQGVNKPYEASEGFWVKDGADKRKARREELLRLFQASGSLYADEVGVPVDLGALDRPRFERFYEEAFGERADDAGVAFPVLLANLKLAVPDGQLTLAGLLLFSPRSHDFKPQFTVKATHYPGVDRAGERFEDKEDLGGTLLDQFLNALAFLKRNLRRVQRQGDFNEPGVLEVPEAALAEALANALVHRDYFIQAQVSVDLFADRVEITSPGTLPNTVTEENIRYGVHVERNPVILTFMQKMKEFRYTGRGSGIPRILKLCRQNEVRLDFVNDTSAERFRVIFGRKPADFRL